jgi:acyl-coenzyme A synthetase/AMP-(fatty) acid ligase
VEVLVPQPERLPGAVLSADAGAGATGVVDAMTAAVTPSDPLVVMFTSGSSGMPKGVVHSHGNALRAVLSSLGPRCIGAGTRLYLPMPFFWVGGFGSGVLPHCSPQPRWSPSPHPTPKPPCACSSGNG